jgi:hypothetical protein
VAKAHPMVTRKVQEVWEKREGEGWLNQLSGHGVLPDLDAQWPQTRCTSPEQAAPPNLCSYASFATPCGRSRITDSVETSARKRSMLCSQRHFRVPGDFRSFLTPLMLIWTDSTDVAGLPRPFIHR